MSCVDHITALAAVKLMKDDHQKSGGLTPDNQLNLKDSLLQISKACGSLFDLLENNPDRFISTEVIQMLTTLGIQLDQIRQVTLMHYIMCSSAGNDLLSDLNKALRGGT